MSHRFSLAAAIVAGLYTGITAPGERLFELTMRALGIAGTSIVMLALIWSMVVIFLVMLITYGIAWVLLDVLQRRREAFRTSSGARR